MNLKIYKKFNYKHSNIYNNFFSLYHPLHYDTKFNNLYFFNIFYSKYSNITFSDYLLFTILIKRKITNFNFNFVKNIKYFENDIKLLNTDFLSKKNTIEYNINNINIHNQEYNIKTLQRLDIGTIGFNWLNELLYNNSTIINSLSPLKIIDLNINLGNYPTSFTHNNKYIENVSLIKAVMNLRKKYGITNYNKDSYTYNYLNYKDLNKHTTFLNWYNCNLNLNLNRNFNKMNIKSIKYNNKFNLIYNNLILSINANFYKNNMRYESFLLREPRLLSGLLYTVLFTFINLEIKGNLIIKLYETYNKATQDLLVLLFLYFENVKFFRPEIINDNLIEKFIICKNFKGVNCELINKLIKIKIEIDNNLPDYGINLNIKEKDRTDNLFKSYLPPYENINDNYFVTSFINYKDVDQLNNNKKGKNNSKNIFNDINKFITNLNKFDEDLIKKQIKYKTKVYKFMELINTNKEILNATLQAELKNLSIPLI